MCKKFDYFLPSGKNRNTRELHHAVFSFTNSVQPFWGVVNGCQQRGGEHAAHLEGHAGFVPVGGGDADHAAGVFGTGESDSGHGHGGRL